MFNLNEKIKISVCDDEHIYCGGYDSNNEVKAYCIDRTFTSSPIQIKNKKLWEDIEYDLCV